MRVELDVFSGRPNPRWELDEDSAVALRCLLSRLSVSTDTPPKEPGLGYRGFVFAGETGRQRAYKGYVIRSDTVFADPSSSIERFLSDRLPTELRDLRSRIALEGE
jgi:hypothetical protein